MRADRLLQLLYLLRRHGRLPARRLAELLQVSERTILRDMEALSVAGVPVYCEQGRGGGCVLMEGYETDVSGLSGDEAQALFAWTSRAAVTDLGLGPQLATALTKLAATVPQPALERADALAAVVVVDRRRWFAAAEEVPILPELREAALRRTRVRLSYRGFRDDRPKARTVDPYGLVENAGRWYLLAAHRGEVRSYRVSRISAMTTLAEPARVPTDLDLAAEWAKVRSAFESREGATVLTVAVDPSVLHRFRLVAGSQATSGSAPEVVDDSGDWPVLRLSVRAREAAVALLLGFGGQIRLLDQPDLRQEMLDRARAALTLHA
ncbi:MAG: WYL domain-containing protein [Lapillicoccus sp.]